MSGAQILAPRLPVPLAERAQAQIGDERHRMVRDGRFRVLRAQVGDAPAGAWASTLEEDYAPDLELANHYTATHAASPFVQRIMMRALTDGGRVTVMNRDVTVWRGNTPEPRQLADRTALRALLVEHFGFDLPQVEGLRVPSIPQWA